MDIQKDDRKACGKEQTGDRDWKVTFEGGFYGQRGRRGIEIPVGKTFSWGKEIWHVPAVYQCGKGLVADIFAEIDPERVKAFLERYRDLEEDRLTEEEQERIQQESPLETGFQPEIILNGRKLRGVEGNGLCWLPESCREMDAGALNDGPAEEYPELDNDGDPVEDPAAEEYPAADPYEEERRLLEHYGLDPAKAWSMNRWSFSWATKRPPKLRSLSLTMKRDRVCIPGIRFTVRGPGDQIPFIHPSTGERHVLTVLEYQEEEMDRKAFEAPEDMEQEERRRLLRRMGEWEYPTHLTAMTYAVSPEISRRALQIQDCGGDRPRRILPREPEDRFLPEAKNDVCVMAGASAIGIIGGADGPTAIFMAGKGEPRCTFSSLYFEPGKPVEWRMRFYEQRVEDLEVKLL